VHSPVTSPLPACRGSLQTLTCDEHPACLPALIILKPCPGPGRIVKNEASALGGKRKYVRRAGPGPGRRKHNSDGDSDLDVTPAVKKRKKRKVRSCSGVARPPKCFACVGL